MPGAWSGKSFCPLFTRSLRSFWQQKGAAIDGFYYCPHHPEGVVEQYRISCDCRKPLPGMLLRAARELSIDLAASYVIGDKSCDIELGRNAGARSILVLTGYGVTELALHRKARLAPPDYIAAGPV